jgi:hypothetical protein
MNPAQKSLNDLVTSTLRTASRRSGKSQFAAGSRDTQISELRIEVSQTTFSSQVSTRDFLSDFASRARNANLVLGWGEFKTAPLRNIYATIPIEPNQPESAGRLFHRTGTP